MHCFDPNLNCMFNLHISQCVFCTLTYIVLNSALLYHPVLSTPLQKLKKLNFLFENMAKQSFSRDTGTPPGDHPTLIFLIWMAKTTHTGWLLLIWRNQNPFTPARPHLVLQVPTNNYNSAPDCASPSLDFALEARMLC